MPELKHTFSKGRMNKDLDERLVPNGEYRDALNVEVSTSEASNVGTVQTLKGNTVLTTHVDAGSTCVGAIADEQNDKIYWLVAGPSSGHTTTSGSELHIIYRDWILEHKVSSNTTKYVMVDIHAVVVTASAIMTSSTSLQVFDSKGIRRGMTVSGAGAPTGTTVSSVDHSTNTITLSANGNINALNTLISFEAPTNKPNNLSAPRGRALNLQSSRLVTGLNIIDGLIFWTDNHTEPKKINVERSIFGTGFDNATTTGTGNTDDFQTRLVTTDNFGDFEFTVDTGTIPIYISEKYITVIKTPPLTPPVLNMSSTIGGRGNILGTTDDMRFYDSNVLLIAGDSADLVINPFVDYQVGDILILNNDSTLSDFVDHLVRLKVTGTPATNGTTNTWNTEVLSVSEEAIDDDEVWAVLLEQPRPMFERKFVRFAYRYKFEDGEYSTFSPFSNVAFLPGQFDYIPKKGHNLGMINDLRTLKIQDFRLEKSLIPRDVVEIDILYREDGSPNIYTVKTVSKDSDEWNANGSSVGGLVGGEVLIESDTIHATVPSNQILRDYDAVPRKALAQDMVGNRVVYANYLEGYDLINSNKEDIDVSLQTSLDIDNITTYEFPEKSLKSMRNYQIGIVYRDVYGRQTPVLITENDATKQNTLKVPKAQSVSSSRLVTQILNEPPEWADSFKFFVKETSNEYYNLVMDRWYNAADGNIWLSFPSSERNKIDEETFLILKKKHQGTTPVFEDVKYKILAIENEAPDFIKITNSFLDTIANGSVGSATNAVFGDTAGSAGYPLYQTDHVIVNYQHWQDSALSDEVTSGDCFLRFRATNIGTSKFYRINAIKVDANDNTVKLVIEGNFQTDINFTSTANSYATRISGLRMDVKRQTPENRPEFDGKFFVKIHKDFNIIENVTGGTVSNNDGDLQVSSQMRIRYVQSSAQPNDGNVSITNTLDPAGRVFFGAPTSRPGYNNGVMDATKWENNTDIGTWATTLFPNASFQSSVNAQHGGFSVPNNDIESTSNGSKYWKAFAEAGVGVTSGSEDNNHLFIDETYFHEWNDDPGQNNFNSTKGYGQGLRQDLNNSNRDLLDISFANIHPGGKKGNWKDVFSSSEYGLAADFMDKLYQVGTQFRWKEDPDQIIYTVEETVYKQDYIKNYLGGSGINGTGPKNDAENKRVKWTMSISPKTGQGPSGYVPTVMLTHDEVDASTYADGLGPPAIDYNHGNVGATSGSSSGTKGASLMQPHGNSPGHTLQILEPLSGINTPLPKAPDNPGMWETEPKEDIGLDIYYEVGNTYPITLDSRTNEQFIPYGSTFVHSGTTYTVSNWNDETVSFTGGAVAIPDGTELTFVYPSEYGSTTSLTDKPGKVTATADGVGTSGTPSTVKLIANIHSTSKFTLPWYNCFSFGNGVESNRIRDDFNATFIDKGVKVSTTTDTPYAEQRKGSSLIFGGIYNSRNGINNTNQFIKAEGITKDLNPKYGTIQKLHTRDGDIVALCEDKIFKIIAYKDALFNADGNPQLIATNRVLGTATPVRGEYGISKNPESFVFQGYQAYFTDKARGVILRMSMDGLTAISNVGMKDYFSDTLKATTGNIIGTYDDKKSEYNVTLNNTTLAWNEGTKGWVSFKSYLPEAGVSFNNTYYTYSDGELYQHHDNSTRNNFYGTQYDSSITVLLNDGPGSVKNYKTLNYEGSQAKITQFRTSTLNSVADDLDGTYGDGQYYNLNASTGWYVDTMITDLQEGKVGEFKEKEGKWFNYIKGVETTLSNLDQKEFSVQGIGEASAVSRSDSGDERDFKLNVTENND